MVYSVYIYSVIYIVLYICYVITHQYEWGAGAGHSLIILLLNVFFFFFFFVFRFTLWFRHFCCWVNVVDRFGWRWIQFCCVRSVFAYYYYYLQCRRADRKAAYMETRHRAVLSRFVLLIVCIRFGFGFVWFSIWFSNYMVAEGFEFEFRVRFRVRIVSFFGLEQQTQRFMAFGTECKLDKVFFFLFFRIACILRRGKDRV